MSPIRLEDNLTERDLPRVQRLFYQLIGRTSFLIVVQQLGGKSLRIPTEEELKQRVSMRVAYQEYRIRNPGANDLQAAMALHCSIESIRRLRKRKF